MKSQSNLSYCKYVHSYTESFMTILATYQCCVSKVCIHILFWDGIFLQAPLLLAAMKGGSYPTVVAQ